MAGERGRKLITELLRLGSVDKDIILCFSAVPAERVTKLITEPFKTKVSRETHYMLSSLDILSMCHTDCRPGTKEIRAQAHSDPKESWSGSNMRDRHDQLLHNGACYKQYCYPPVNRKLNCRTARAVGQEDEDVIYVCSRCTALGSIGRYQGKESCVEQMDKTRPFPATMVSVD